VVVERKHGAGRVCGRHRLAKRISRTTSVRERRLEDASLFLDNSKPENGMVPYEGQEANCYVVAQWWENGEKTMLIECEYDSEM